MNKYFEIIKSQSLESPSPSLSCTHTHMHTCVTMASGQEINVRQHRVMALLYPPSFLLPLQLLILSLSLVMKIV